MVVSDVVEEEATHPAEEITIACAQCSSEESETLCGVVRECRIGVLKEHNHHYPVVAKHVWDAIQSNDIREGTCIRPICKHRKHHDEPDVRGNDTFPLRRFEER